MFSLVREARARENEMEKILIVCVSYLKIRWANYSSWESALNLAKVLYTKSISKLLILWDNQEKDIIKTDQQRTTHKFLSPRNLDLFLCLKTSALLNQTGYVPVSKKTCNF